jgi:hypothetical protein
VKNHHERLAMFLGGEVDVTYIAIHYDFYIINLAHHRKDLIEHVVCDTRIKITDIKSFTTFVCGHVEKRICKR